MLTSFLLPFRGLSDISRPGLRRFVAIPLAINLLLYVGIGWLAVSQFEDVINGLLPDKGFLSSLRWLFWLIFVPVYALITFYTFTALANLIGAPFNSLLSKELERQLTGVTPQGSESFVSSILNELRKLLYFLSRMLPVLLLLLIPGINALASVLLILMGFWFLGLEYCDYPLANRGITFKQQRYAFRGNRLAILGLGAGISLLMLIPILNFAAMPAAVAGATRLNLEKLIPASS